MEGSDATRVADKFGSSLVMGLFDACDEIAGAGDCFGGAMISSIFSVEPLLLGAKLLLLPLLALSGRPSSFEQNILYSVCRGDGDWFPLDQKSFFSDDGRFSDRRVLKVNHAQSVCRVTRNADRAYLGELTLEC